MTRADVASAPELDFDAAATFVERARQAHAKGEYERCLAARKLVAVALHLTEDRPVTGRTGH